MKKRVYVKPVSNLTGLFGWITLELNIVQSFLDDLKRYNLFIALKNCIEVLNYERTKSNQKKNNRLYSG